jgi:hypothetical protein
VAGYPRPGAVFTHVAMQHIKEVQNQTRSKRIDPPRLQAFVADLMK